jgi:hypothetical protein
MLEESKKISRERRSLAVGSQRGGGAAPGGAGLRTDTPLWDGWRLLSPGMGMGVLRGMGGTWMGGMGGWGASGWGMGSAGLLGMGDGAGKLAGWTGWRLGDGWSHWPAAGILL